MSNQSMEELLKSSSLAGINQSYIEDLYEIYLEDPNSLDNSWKELFAKLPPVEKTEQAHSKVREHFRDAAKLGAVSSVTNIADTATLERQAKLLDWINTYRFRGHLEADVDPIDVARRSKAPDLDYKFHGFTEADLNTKFNVGKVVFNKTHATLAELDRDLKKVYCSTLGFEFMHVHDGEQRQWLQNKIETLLDGQFLQLEERKNLLEELTAADGLERYLGAKFPGAKRFSLEGSDAFIPVMKELVRHFGKSGGEEVVVGMAHRGRLNLLVNLFGKKPKDLFDEFAGVHTGDGTGDVKYHQGFSCNFDAYGNNMHLSLAFNPSHLEIVSPVVIGSVRAKQKRLNDIDAGFDKVLAITVHGDSAVSGQGIVQESLNMSQTRGYRVGGAIRVVINNQIGFTTSFPRDTKSTDYCTDIAKMIQAPVIHVNGDDPEACVFAARLAIEYRNKFKRDIFIDIISYRRNGHNEADEPSATQPMMYKKIKSHQTPRKIYADRLIAEKVIDEKFVTLAVNEYREALDRGNRVVKEWLEFDASSSQWNPYLKQYWDNPYETKFDRERFTFLANRLCDKPDGFKLHPRVEKIYADRLAMANGEKALDWGMAELMAYATLVDAGYAVRLSGEDAGRGTFFHRHSVMHNQNDGTSYVPLAHLHPEQANFDVWDSVLSEAGVLGFEYGYATTSPTTLTLWEAQFGDFANCAQVVIDQFISSGEQKWNRYCGLVMLLPHGFEGQGPEHSSARLERYLQLCAQENMQVCIPSTPAQVYHMLRRQMLRNIRRPLIVISPKSLLRHPRAISSIDELVDGEFKHIIGDHKADNSKVKRVVLCSGKVYYDLLNAREENGLDETVAIVRIEQLYPYSLDILTEELSVYTNATDFIWCQEEPKNQGAWYICGHGYNAALPAGHQIQFVGREASASPAVGYAKVHSQQQTKLVNEALGLI